MKKLLFIIVVFLCGFTSAAQRTTITVASTNPSARWFYIDYAPHVPFYHNAFNQLRPQQPFATNNGAPAIVLQDDKPHVVSIAQMGRPRYLFVEPGDRVECVKISTKQGEDSLYFTGKNSSHYNYAFAYARRPIYYSEQLGLVAYRDRLWAQYRDEKRFLEQYAAQHPCSQAFVDYQTDDLNNWLIAKIYYPIYFGHQEQLPSGYCDSLPQPRNPISPNYMSAMLYSSIDRADYAGTIARIEARAEGEQKTYLRVLAVYSYALDQDKSYGEAFEHYARTVRGCVTTKQAQKYVDDAMSYYRIAGSPIPQEVLSTTRLQSLDSDTLTLGQLFAQHVGKPIYIDFWASWCGGCREDIAQSAETKKWLESKGVVYIYLAYADKESAWQKAAAEDQITTNQYFLEEGRLTPIRSYFDVQMIPHYVLLDAQHKVVVNGAARPRPDTFSLLQEQISKALPEQTVTYY